MFFTNNYSIKEVLAFPMMRGEAGRGKLKQDVVTTVAADANYGADAKVQQKIITELEAEVAQLRMRLAKQNL